MSAAEYIDYNNLLYQAMTEHKEYSRLAYKLAARVHIDIEDARSLMLSYLYDTVSSYLMNQNCSAREAYDIFSAGGQAARYFINYTIYNSYKECVRHCICMDNQIRVSHNNKIDKIEIVSISEDIIKSINNNNITINIDEIIDIIYQVLPKQPADFASYLLLNGAEETMSYYHYTDRHQLNKRLSYIEKIMDKKRPEYKHLLLSPYERRCKHDLDTLTRFTDLLESDSYTDNQFYELLNELQNVNIVINLMADTFPHVCHCIQNWGSNGQPDYDFINAIYAEKNRLQSILQGA